MARKREQAASWFERRAQAGGVIGVQFRANAVKVREGQADHRLQSIIVGQAEYDKLA